MAIPVKKRKSKLDTEWGRLQNQWGAKGVRLRTRSRGGDVGGSYDPKTKTITLNRERLREEAKREGKDLDKHTRSVMRHELSHFQSEKTGTAGRTHGGSFGKINRNLSGSHSGPPARRKGTTPIRNNKRV